MQHSYIHICNLQLPLSFNNDLLFNQIFHQIVDCFRNTTGVNMTVYVLRLHIKFYTFCLNYHFFYKQQTKILTQIDENVMIMFQCSQVHIEVGLL